MLGKLFDVLGRLDGEVITNPGRNEHLLDAGQRAGASVELDERGVIGVEIGAHPRVYARRPAAGRLDLAALTRKSVHVGCWSAEIGNHAGEARNVVADLLDLADDGILGAALDDPAFVL